MRGMDFPPPNPATVLLTERGENPTDLNVFSSRRGNWEAMIRGLFTNKTVQNLLGDAIPPGSTIHASSGEILSLWDAAQRYATEGQPIVVVAGERYGMGSSRDWATKGAALLGVRAVLARSFERIHRSNLIGMGVLPLRLPEGHGPNELSIRVEDDIQIAADAADIFPRCPVTVSIKREDGSVTRFCATAAIETNAEIEILRAGGILPMILSRVSGAARNG